MRRSEPLAREGAFGWRRDKERERSNGACSPKRGEHAFDLDLHELEFRKPTPVRIVIERADGPGNYAR